MLLKGKTHNVDVDLKIKKIKKFQEQVCKEDESLLSYLPNMLYSRESISQIVELLSFFQVGNELLPIDDDEKFDLYDFLDEYIEENESSVMDLGLKIIEEFDIKGAISRGMGFSMTKAIRENLANSMKNLSKQVEETKNQPQ